MAVTSSCGTLLAGHSASLWLAGVDCSWYRAADKTDIPTELVFKVCGVVSSQVGAQHPYRRRHSQKVEWKWKLLHIYIWLVNLTSLRVRFIYFFKCIRCSDFYCPVDLTLPPIWLCKDNKGHSALFYSPLHLLIASETQHRSKLSRVRVSGILRKEVGAVSTTPLSCVLLLIPMMSIDFSLTRMFAGSAFLSHLSVLSLA